ncbi:MAG: sigma-70 family RNA polymerase sigma factor [Bacteroidales bacterium]|nr:sigma-70 family RNA polymerase sigma factor [Bacteroidales bacterium]
MKTNELHIIAQVLGGKTEAFSYFMDTYGQQVFHLIVRMVGSEEDAEELTQDTFMKAFSHLSSFCGNSSFSTWIYRIAYNTALSALRKHSTEEVLTFDEGVWERLSDTEIDESLDSEEESRIERLQHAIRQLSPEEQALLTLFYEEGKTVAELAEIVKQTENNVKVKLHRIRKKLYLLMKEEENK